MIVANSSLRLFKRYTCKINTSWSIFKTCWIFLHIFCLYPYKSCCYFCGSVISHFIKQNGISRKPTGQRNRGTFFNSTQFIMRCHNTIKRGYRYIISLNGHIKPPIIFLSRTGNSRYCLCLQRLNQSLFQQMFVCL